MVQKKWIVKEETYDVVRVPCSRKEELSDASYKYLHLTSPCSGQSIVRHPIAT